MLKALILLFSVMPDVLSLLLLSQVNGLLQGLLWKFHQHLAQLAPEKLRIVRRYRKLIKGIKADGKRKIRDMQEVMEKMVSAFEQGKKKLKDDGRKIQFPKQQQPSQ